MGGVRMFAKARMQRIEVIEAEIHAALARRAAWLMAVSAIVVEIGERAILEAA